MKEKMKGRETQRIEKVREEKQRKFNLKLLGEQKKNKLKKEVQLNLGVFIG